MDAIIKATGYASKIVVIFNVTMLLLFDRDRMPFSLFVLNILL